jgi:cytochrome c
MSHRFVVTSLAVVALSALSISAQADEPAAPPASKSASAPAAVSADKSASAAPSAADQPAAAAPACDLTLGKRVFGQCSICHSLDKDAPPVAGPNLHGVVGRTAASSPGFSYSKALRDSAKQWTAQELDHFLEQPMSSVPGTMMAFAGLKKPEERAAVICYMETNSK